MTRIFVVLIALALAGCASTPPDSDAVFFRGHSLRVKHLGTTTSCIADICGIVTGNRQRTAIRVDEAFAGTEAGRTITVILSPVLTLDPTGLPRDNFQLWYFVMAKNNAKGEYEGVLSWTNKGACFSPEDAETYGFTKLLETVASRYPCAE